MSVNTINTKPTNLAYFCQLLSELKEQEGKRLHLVGSGLSGRIGQLLGESFKDIGFSVSIFGDSLALPVRKDDLVFAICGSGWTKYTTEVIEKSLQNKAKILTLTGDPESKASRLSDEVIRIPLGYQPTDHVNASEIADWKAPLSPLGAIFELTSFVIGIGIINGVFTGSCTKGFDDGTSKVLGAAEETFTNLTTHSNLKNFINIFSGYFNNKDRKIFFIGDNSSQIIADLSAIRFQQLYNIVHSISDWRFRKAGDLLLILAGSGDSRSTLDYLDSAKNSGMTILSLITSPDSELAEKSDFFLEMKYQNKDFKNRNLQLNMPILYLPVFEYISAITLEACVAQLALDYGRTLEI